jgi:hypothetical protein
MSSQITQNICPAHPSSNFTRDLICEKEAQICNKLLKVKKSPKCRKFAQSGHPDGEVGVRVARFFLAHDTKTGKMYQMTTNYTNGHKLCQMDVNIPVIKYINIFRSKALQNLPKLGFLV